MPEILGAVLSWAVPIVVVFGVTAIALAVGVWALRRARRSPAAVAAAGAERDRAGAALVRLDDAVSELEVEVGLSGALYGGGAPSSLRRARLTAQHVRDEAFDEFRSLTEEDAEPAEVRRRALRIERRVGEASAVIERARTEHHEWMRTHVSAASQVEAAQARLAQLRTEMGDPAALVADLRRFDESEWRTAARAAESASAAALTAENLLAGAASAAADPTRDALGDLARADRSLRAAAAAARQLEESHRLVTQAAQAVPAELAAARDAVRQALAVREQLEPDDAERLGREVRSIDADLTALATDAARRPTRTIEGIAHLRSRLDLALGDARTAQQRLRGARTALPGTLAAARGVLATAEAAVERSHAGADARARLGSAQRELAWARDAQDPVEALDAARRAMRHAEDAKALADYAGGARS